MVAKRKNVSMSSRSRKKQKVEKFSASGSGRVPRNIVTLSGNRNIATVTRMWQNQYSKAAATDELLALSFQLSDLPNYTQFTNLYDQYRILAVKVEFVARTPPVQYYGVSAISSSAPVLYTAIDLDDVTTPTSTTLLAHESCKFHGAFTPMSTNKYVRWLKPATAVEMYQTGGFGGYGARQNQWIDTTSSSVQHYGIKWWIATAATTPAYYYDVVFTYYMEFKLPV